MNSSSPLVSVLITTYNYAKYLPELCRSVQAQTYQNFEVVVLDNGSTDETRSVLSLFEEDPRFRVFGWEKNRGFTPAFQDLLTRGGGDCWICPGADDVLFPDFLERRLALMQAHPNAAVVHGAAEIIDASGKTIPSPFPPLALPTHLHGTRGLEILLQHNVINFPSALVRYAVTRKVLRFFLRDWQYVTDWHLWILLLADGADFLWDERPAHNCRVHSQSLSRDPSHAAIRRAESRLAPLCALRDAAQFSPVAADCYVRWRKTLYRLWLLRAFKMRCQGVLQDQWLQAAGQAYYDNDHRAVGLFAECVKHGPGVAIAGLKERRALRRQSFRVSGLAEINDPIFRRITMPAPNLHS